MKHAVPLVLLAAAACAETLPETPADADGCGAAALVHLIGEDMSALAAMSFPDRTRFIRPGDAITMDYSQTRLNFDLDADGRITRIWCG